MRILSLFGLVTVMAAFLGAPVRAQAPDAPAKPEELLTSFQTLFEQGKYDLAAEYLKAYLASEPTDQQLLDVEKRYGTGVFQNLQTIPKWSDDPAADKAARETVAALTARVRAATDKILRDPARIARFVNNLGETYEERVYAVNELRRAGDVVVPYMVDAYRNAPSPALEAGILDTITRLDAASVAGWLAALDGLTPAQRYGVFTSILARPDVLNLPAFAETDFTPILWYLAALPAEEAPELRKLVFALLSRLTPADVRKQDPVEELVRIARTFYDHKGRFRTATNPDPAGVGVVLWTWDAANQKLVRAEKTPIAKAEEYYGLRYARWALDRKPDYEPAQRLVLSLAVERAVERGQFGELARTAPAVYQLLASTPTPLLSDLLGEALARKQTGLVLGLTQVLGDRAEKSVAMPRGSSSRPALLVRSLDYPDIRVQIAAANGLLRSPATLTPEIRARILTVLKAAAGSDAGIPADSKGQALIVDPSRFRNDALAALLRSLGYSVEQYMHGRDLLRRVGQGADYDLVIVDRHVVNPQLTDFLSQLRSDLKSGGVPVAVVASPDKPLRPTLDGMLLRMATLIAATETDGVEVPAPYVPNLRNLADDNDRNKAANLVQRDSALRTVARKRIERLTRVIDNSNMALTTPQRALLNLRIEQVTWALMSAQYPITPESSPVSAAYLSEFTSRLALQPPIAPYTGIGMEGFLQRIERLQVEVDENPVIKTKFDALRAAIDVDGLGIDVGATRDPNLEASLAKKLVAYPGVSVIPLPYSRVGFEDELKRTYADAGRVPRDAAEKLAASRMAIDWLRQMATGEVPGFDATKAAAELIRALGTDELASSAIEGVARVNTGEAQQALLNVALSGTRPAPIRVKAADATIRHVQTHGKLIPQTQIAALVPLAGSEPNAEVKTKLVVLKGLLAHDTQNFLNELRQFTPMDPPAPMPPAGEPAPVPAPAPAPAP